MDLLYFITRLNELDKFYSVLSWVLFGCGVISCVCWLVAILNRIELLSSNEDKSTDSFVVKRNSTERFIIKSRKYISRFFIAWVVVMVFDFFTPTEEAAYVIYGIGNTIDYCRNDSTVKKLPPKAIEALNIYADKVLNDLKKDTSNKEKADSTAHTTSLQ